MIALPSIAKTTRVVGIAAATLALLGCESPPRDDARVGRAWREDCASIAEPAPLSLDAARTAHRLADRRHELRLREAAKPGFFLAELHRTITPERIATGEVCPAELADLGQLVFEHEYHSRDGLGGGESAASPRGPFRRVHGGLFGGPETISCTSCHWIGGPNGAGAETDNAFLVGDGEQIRSGDARNPQALVALGVVQALAREMSRDLQRQRVDLVREAARLGTDHEVRLHTKGVDFGKLRSTAKGEVDVSGLDGVDADLTVKPFGWKGTLADLEEFVAEALQVHLGIQSEVLLARGSAELKGSGSDREDPDADGVRGELGESAFAAMMMHLALLELPTIDPLIQDRALGPAAEGLLPPTTTSFAKHFQRGREHFRAIGCASCHVPMMVLENTTLEIDGFPPIDLAKEMREPALRYDAELGGYPVWLFSDLKRHDMGKSNVAKHEQRGVALAEYLTPRLWSVADSAPYLHDGRAPSFDYAIAAHDGEGSTARAAFDTLSFEEQGALRVYLMSLRRSPRLMVP
jgi:hypothetical protein